MTENNTRELDVILFGATGLAGGYSARELSQVDGLRLGVAGRKREEIEAIAQSLKATPVIADATDFASLVAMAKRAKVIASTTGPFIKHGTGLVKACVQEGTHYCDITGEIPWAREMIERFSQDAERNNTTLISFSGFDSIPSDVGVYLCAKGLRERGESLINVQGVFSAKGGFSGGTAHSALSTFEGSDNVRKILGDPYGLCPDLEVPKGARKRNPNSLSPIKFEGRTLAPFFMAPVNTRVVRRSDLLFAQEGQGYGERFSYQEHMSVGEVASAPKAWMVAGATVAGGALISNKIGRKVLKGLMPKPGEGPNKEEIESGFMRGDFTGFGEGGNVIKVRVQCEGDPGNITTSKCLASVALCLARGHARRAGFLTPTFAFGDHLIETLNQRGVVTNALD